MNAHQIVNTSDQKEFDSVGAGDGGVSLPSLLPLPLNRKRVGRYEILYPIAQGGMAEVYTGRLTGIAGFQRVVAIKTIHSHLSSQENFIRMFLDEARLAAGIHHPNVGEVIEVGEDTGLYYMVCELILGQSLKSFRRQALQQAVLISPAMYARIVSTTGFALQAAHDLLGPDGAPLNIVHRDVSPRNILISYDGVVKLIDFGIAHAQGRISHTDTGTLKGKLAYMSPEQLQCAPLDRRSDVFSLGVVLYQLLTGQQAFHGKSDIEKLNRILANRFTKPRDIVPEIPVELEKIILRAMAHSPDDRYPSAAAMSTALEDYILDTGERVDQFALSHLMGTLFKEEIVSHQKKIRAAQNNIGSGASQDVGGVVVPRGRTTIPARPAGRHTPSPESRTDQKISFRISSIKAFVIGGIVATVLGVALFILTSPQSDTRNDDTASLETKPDISEDEPVESTTRPASRQKSAVNARVAVPSNRNALPLPPIDKAVEKAEITLAITPKDARLELNGVAIAPNTKSLRLSEGDGPYRLRVSSEGYLPHEEKIAVNGNSTVSVSLRPAVRKHSAGYKKQGKRKKRARGNNAPAVKTGKTSKKKSPSLAGSPYL